MMFNKSARTISDHLVFWIPKFLYLTIAFLSVVFLVRMLVINHIDASGAEAKILTNRIYFSPNIISYYDPDIERAYPGIVDIEKYTKLQSLEINSLDAKSMAYSDNKLIAAKITLKNMETNAEYVIFYNKENYDYWEPRILSTVIGGSGSVKSINEQRYVLIKIGNQLQKGILKMQVIVRK